MAINGNYKTSEFGSSHRFKTEKHLEKRLGDGNVDIRLQVQLEEDGGGSTRQSWMEASDLWPMIHWE